MGLSEALAVYSGVNDVLQAGTIFGDSAWSLGMSATELALGVDCPYTSELLDVTFLNDAAKPTTLKRCICVFEQSHQRPLHRHYARTAATSGGLSSYGGLPMTSLVVR